MRHDFNAASFGKHLVLYDPAAIPDDFPFDHDTDTPQPASPPIEALKELAADGNALVLEIPEGDCEATIRVMMNESLPSKGKRRSHSLLKSKLNIPSGLLTAGGAEVIHPTPRARKHADATIVEVPSGSYQLEVLDQIAWKASTRDSYIESRTTPRSRRIAKAVDVIAFSWLVLLVSTILIIPGIIVLLWVNLGHVAAAVGIGVTLAIHAAYLVAFAALQWASDCWPEIDQATLARSEFERDNPDIVVALRIDHSNDRLAIPAFMVINGLPATS